MNKKFTKSILAAIFTIFSVSFFTHHVFAIVVVGDDSNNSSTCQKYLDLKEKYAENATRAASYQRQYDNCVAGIKNNKIESLAKTSQSHAWALQQCKDTKKYGTQAEYNSCLNKAISDYSYIQNNANTSSSSNNNSNSNPGGSTSPSTVVDNRTPTGTTGGAINNSAYDSSNTVPNTATSDSLPELGSGAVNWADTTVSFDGREGNDCQGFLGLTSWDCGVNISNQDSLVNGISLIAVNILTDITIIAAYLVLGYVIYGGYLYIFSGGDPGKVAAGKKTLTQAFIGLAIVMSANLIMSSIRFALLGANGKLSGCATSECVDGNALVTGAIQWFVGIGGAVATVFVVYGGIGYITSSGDPSKLQKAKNAIIYALIGLIICALAEVITAIVSNIVRDATTGNIPLVNETIIAKELHEKIT